MKEYEKKILLTQHEYQYLLQTSFGKCQEKCQINYYYDTVCHYMYRNQFSCRIRETEGTLTQTVKMLRPDDPDCREEESKAIVSVPDSLNWKGKSLKKYGHLVTNRRKKRLSGGVIVYLDENFYLGQTDYELEIAYEQGNEIAVMQYLKQIGIQLKSRNLITEAGDIMNRVGTKPGKCTRFMELYLKQEGDEHRANDYSQTLLAMEQAYFAYICGNNS